LLAEDALIARLAAPVSLHAAQLLQAPSGACVAQRDSNPIYATNQCDALKGKNLKLLWGGVAVAGAGLSMMILGTNTSAQITRDGVGLFHRVRF